MSSHELSHAQHSYVNPVFYHELLAQLVMELLILTAVRGNSLFKSAGNKLD